MGILDRLRRWLFADPNQSADAYFSRPEVWTAVASSNVEAIAYFAGVERGREAQILAVRFLAKGRAAGSVYYYYGVPVSVYIDMVSASSKGRFVHSSLKNAYPYRRVK